MDTLRVVERRPTESPKDYIERLRREKFHIGTGTICMKAPDLHRTIEQLSVELYQNDFHFIKEIIQNAEDNNYAEDVCPCLELQLIQEDIAEVGASATLLVLNNELGLRTEDVIALCSAGKSTKIGKRNEGYIGCKGIGFKSVFMICESPMIISNGYRIRFRDAVNKEAGMGYIVPEWIKSPSNDAILSAIGGDKLPTTVIILPIRDSKVELVRKQLKEISPEIILFLSRIRELKVVDKTKHAVDSIELLRITRSKPISGIRSDVCKFFEVTLSVESTARMVKGTLPYLIFKQAYPVTHPVQERKEIHEWTVTLAFPKERRASSDQVGDVFSFLPTQLRTGFPFIINADFLLTTSRESIRFDSPWNIGILDCIPAAFELSFKLILRAGQFCSSPITHTEALSHWHFKDAYRFLPHYTVWNANRFNSAGATEVRQVRQKLSVEPQQAANHHQLDKVRTNIFQRLEKSALVFLSSLSAASKSLYLISAKACLQIKSSFRDILTKAALSHHPSPSTVYLLPDSSRNPRNGFALVDEYVEANYASGLAALGVPEMTTNQYLRFLKDAEWLISLPEKVYVQILAFFAFELRIPEGSNDFRQLKTIPLFKVRGDDGKVGLKSLVHISQTELFYTSSVKDAEWISAWARQLKNWDHITLMPTEASQSLNEASNGKIIMTWIRKHGSLTELSAPKYAEKLIEKLMVQRTRNMTNTAFSLLVMQCLYSGFCAELLSREVIVRALQNRRHVSIVDLGQQERSVSLKLREEGGVLLPRRVSKWPSLFSFSGGNSWHVIELGDGYLVPQSSLVKDIVTISTGPDSMLEFVKQAFSAVDIPQVRIPATEDFPFQYPVTMEKSVLLFQWLKVFLPSRRLTKSERENDRLLMGLKTLQWLKTCHHGWQSPGSVFVPNENSSFENQFTSRDLPLLDESAYPLDVRKGYSVQFVLEELGVVTDMRKGCAGVAQYFSDRGAEELDQEVVNRFYEFLNGVGLGFEEVVKSIRVWIPACGTRTLPMWRAPAECILSDDCAIFEDSCEVTIVDKIYEESLLPFFSDVLQVPKSASVDLYRKIWLNWSSANSGLTEGLQLPQSLSLVKVQSIWNTILDDWQESSEEDWQSFCSSAWVPVTPLSDDSDTISIVSTDQAFIADDLALSASFSAVADGKLNFAWLLPCLSATKKECLVELYSKMGVRRLSEFVTCDVNIAPNVWKKKVAQGKGLICEGLFRTVLAYLCKKGVQFEDRKQILATLTSATEIVVSEPFEVCSSLHVETMSSPATVPKKVYSHFDRVKGKLYYLRKDHDILQGDIAKRVFNARLVTVLSLGILSEHLELVQDLTILLKLLCDAGFAMKSVEYELQAQNLSIFPEDEKLLMENEAAKHPPKRVLRPKRGAGSHPTDGMISSIM